MSDYDRIERVIRFLEQRFKAQPDLATLAEVAGLSEFHFQRMFSRWAGVSPKSFLQCLTHAHAKRLLESGASVLDASLDSGLSGPGRLHDLCVKLEAATPGDVKSGGAGWTIHFGFAESPFGIAAVGESARGLCHLSFVDNADRQAALLGLQSNWPAAAVRRDDEWAGVRLSEIFQSGARARGTLPLKAFVKGTRFQIQVWQALLNIPPGEVSTYKRLAKAVGSPRAMRAIGTAVGANPIAYLIPCHRVIRESGMLGGYRWGLPRKRALLARESLGILAS